MAQAHQFAVGEYVIILPHSECHPSVWGMTGRIVRANPYKMASDDPEYTWLVEFPTNIPQIEDRAEQSNRCWAIDKSYQLSHFIFYNKELELNIFLTCCWEARTDEAKI